MTTTDKNTLIERKRYFANRNFAENEKGYRRYIAEVTKGVPAEYAREIVKEAFGWTDHRLDGVLETRAGAFSPKTASELEAKALVFIQRVDNNISALCRHCDKQLARLEDMDDIDEDGEPRWTSIELIEETSAKDFKTKRKKMTVADAKRSLLEAKLSYNKQLFDALKALKADTIININRGGELADYSIEELQLMKAEQEKIRAGRVVDAEYTTTD